MYFVCAVCGICINGFGALFLGGHGHSHGGVPCKSHSSPTPILSDVCSFFSFFSRPMPVFPPTPLPSPAPSLSPPLPLLPPPYPCVVLAK